MWKKLILSVIAVFFVLFGGMICTNAFLQSNKLSASTYTSTLSDYMSEFEYGGITWISVLLSDPTTGEGIALSKDILDYRGLSMCHPDRVGCTQNDYSSDARADNPLYKYLINNVRPSFQQNLQTVSDPLELSIKNENPGIEPDIATKEEVESIINAGNKDLITIPANNLNDQHDTTWWTQTNYGGNDFWFVLYDGTIHFHTGMFGFTNQGSGEILGVRPILKMKLPPAEPNIAYESTPGAGASNANIYEYTKNVNANDVIGKIKLNMGLKPITYTLISHNDQSYQNFEIVGLDANDASSADELDIKIKANAPDLTASGLPAAKYSFCINAVDIRGEPQVPTSKSKVCTTLTVEKLSTSITFDQASQTVKTMEDAAASWTEHATPSPNSSELQTKYSITGGDIGLVTIAPDTGQVTYLGNNAYGKVTIRATLDDDPSTGKDNYDSSFVEKEIIIVRGVDGVITPDSASSNTTIPKFSMDQANIKTNGTIGIIKGTLGTPDTIGGSTTTYSYTMKNNGDGSFFKVDANSGVIQTTANLAIGSYHFTITVSDKWSSKDIPVEVIVTRRTYQYH